jgi:hypothetical protein
VCTRFLKYIRGGLDVLKVAEVCPREFAKWLRCALDGYKVAEMCMMP